MRVFQGAGKFEQLVGVVRWIDSAIQHGIIESAFALASELCARKPHERMKPINGASQLGENLRQPIVTRNVREFVGRTVLRRSGDQSIAPAGSKMRGRTNPQVRGMDAGFADRSILTGRVIPSRLRWLETICAHPSSTTGAERAATKASRARPARSLATIKR